MAVTAEQYFNAHLVEKTDPFGINVRRCLREGISGVMERHMADRNAMSDAGCLILLFPVADQPAKVFALLTPPGREVAHTSVLDAPVRLVLASIQHDPPYRIQSEGIVSRSAPGCRRIIGQMLGVVTTCIVISACINHRIRALCDFGRQPMQRGNHFRRIRRISDVTVQYQYLRVRVRQRRMGRRDGIAVRICQYIQPHLIRVLRYGPEIVFRRLRRFRLGVIVAVVGKRREIYPIVTGGVQRGSRNTHLVNQRIGAHNAVVTVRIGRFSDCDRCKCPTGAKQKNLISVLHGTDSRVQGKARDVSH